MKATNPSCKSKSAAASSPTWGSPTSSPPPWIPTTRASRAPSWSSWRRPTPALSTAALPPAHPTSSPPPPASRIIGGYSVKDGQIVPRYSHGEIIEAVFRRTRVTVGIMTAAKLLSAIEPIIRYQRGRFRGGEGTAPGSPRYEFGLQLKEDTLHRLIDIWATGEASASRGFAAARLFDELDPLERLKNEKFAAEGVAGGTSTLRAMRKLQKRPWT